MENEDNPEIYYICDRIFKVIKSTRAGTNKIVTRIPIPSSYRSPPSGIEENQQKYVNAVKKDRPMERS